MPEWQGPVGRERPIAPDVTGQERPIAPDVTGRERPSGGPGPGGAGR